VTDELSLFGSVSCKNRDVVFTVTRFVKLLWYDQTRKDYAKTKFTYAVAEAAVFTINIICVLLLLACRLTISPLPDVTRQVGQLQVPETRYDQRIRQQLQMVVQSSTYQFLARTYKYP